MLFGLTYYLPEAVLTVGDNLEFLIRILVVELFGFLIGLERSKRQKDARNPHALHHRRNVGCYHDPVEILFCGSGGLGYRRA